MSGLRATAVRVATMRHFSTPHHDRALALEKAAARLAERPGGRLQDAEAWEDFLRRIGVVE